MDLFDDINENEIIGSKKRNNNRITKIIIAFIIIILVVIMAIIGVMMYLKSLTMKFYIDGKQMNLNDSYFDIYDNGEIYISIQDIAQLLQIKYYNGDFGKISEDTTKGYISTDEGTVTFEANSNQIYKIDTESNEENYSYMYLDKEIRYTNGKLYTTPDGIEKIMDIVFEYNKDINIYTIDYLNTYYTSIIANYNYKKISDKYVNLKALKYDILIVQREDGKYAIIKPDGTEIVGAKYDDITYVETTGDYIVKSGNKVGIINAQGKSKIDLEYEDIKVLDEDLGLYIVKLNNKYGVVNGSGNIVIYVENEEIGIDRSSFKDSNIKNPYLLFDNCIPVKKEGKWGIYNKSGKIILPIEYSSIGCVVGTSSNRSAGNVVIIEDYEAIVVGLDKYYGIINSTGTQLIPCALDTVYSITTEGKKTYRIEGIQNDSPYSYDLEKYFNAMNIRKVNTSNKESEDIENINNSNSTNTNSNTNQNDNSTNTQENSNENVVNEEVTEETSSEEETEAVEE